MMNHLITTSDIPAVSATQILERLRIEAQALGRPEQRLATLDRLEEACNDIASGKAAEYVQAAARAEPSFKGTYDTYFKRPPIAIRPPRIEEYVKARRTLDQRKGIKSIWTGPTGVTIRGEAEGMLAYVRRREAEQDNPGKKVKRSPALEDYIDQIPDLSGRQAVRFALDDGREAKRQLHLLKQGLLKIPGIDVHAILGQRSGSSALPAPVESASPTLGLSEAETEALQKLVERLTDSTALAGHDLEYDGNRIKNKATKAALVEKPELAVLKRLAGQPDR